MVIGERTSSVGSELKGYYGKSLRQERDHLSRQVGR